MHKIMGFLRSVNCANCKELCHEGFIERKDDEPGLMPKFEFDDSTILPLLILT